MQMNLQTLMALIAIRGRRVLIPAGCLLLLCSVAAFAQSGRKQKKTTPEPPVQGVPVQKEQPPPPPDPEPAPEQPKQKGPRVMVATEMPDFTIPLQYADLARRACIDELRREMRTLELSEDRNVNRSEAMKIAKNDDRTYVVLMELRADSMSSGGLELRYTVYAPKTGKVLSSGAGYPQRSATSAPPISMDRYQYAVELSGRDVAHQVIKKLDLGVPRTFPYQAP